MPVRELPALLHDSDMGLFIVDREGVVRYKQASAYVTEHGLNTIPSVDELVRELERCASPRELRS
jgi:sensor domain CHASE-containing protein